MSQRITGKRENTFTDNMIIFGDCETIEDINKTADELYNEFF